MILRLQPFPSADSFENSWHNGGNTRHCCKQANSQQQKAMCVSDKYVTCRKWSTNRVQWKLVSLCVSVSSILLSPTHLPQNWTANSTGFIRTSNSATHHSSFVMFDADVLGLNNTAEWQKALTEIIDTLWPFSQLAMLKPLFTIKPTTWRVIRTDHTRCRALWIWQWVFWRWHTMLWVECPAALCQSNSSRTETSAAKIYYPTKKYHQ